MASRSLRTTVIGNPAAAVDAPGAPIGNTGAPGFLSREHILEATAGCFAEHGYDGTTVRAIAGRLGCSVGSIYRYFADKRALLTAMASAALVDAMTEPTTAAPTWAASARNYVQAAQAHPEAYRVLFWLAGGAEDAKAMRTPQVVADLLEHWAALLGDEAEARRRWTRLHGLVALGAFEEAMKEAGAGREAGKPPNVVRETPAEAVEVEDEDDEEVEDVTLL